MKRFKQFITERTTPRDKLEAVANYINTEGVTRLAQCYGELANRIKGGMIVPVDTDIIVIYYKTRTGDPVHADMIRNGKVMIQPDYVRDYGNSCSTLEMTWREFREKYLK